MSCTDGVDPQLALDAAADYEVALEVARELTDFAEEGARQQHCWRTRSGMNVSRPH